MMRQIEKDVLNRNDHSNPFQLKIPSHNASQNYLEILSLAYTLNKLALLPLPLHPMLPQLYKLSLEHLLHHTKTLSSLECLLEHIELWQLSMGQFGSWPYARAALNSLEERFKAQPQLMERVVLKRALLETNKQDFLNRARNLQLNDPQLLHLRSLAQQPVQQPSINPPQVYNFPSDLLLIDSDQCWMQIEESLSTINPVELEDYLEEYEKRGVSRFLRVNHKKGKQAIRLGLLLRQQIFEKIRGKPSPALQRIQQSLSV